MRGSARRVWRALGLTFFALVLSGAGATVGTLPAAAAGGPTFSFEPTPSPNTQAPRSSFRYTLNAGSTITDSVLLTNQTNQTEDFEIWTANGYNTPRGGYLALRPQNYKKTDLATWIELPVSSGVHQLPAQTSATLNFNIVVPPNASPGDHVAGIVALNVTPQPSAGSGTQFNIHQGIASAIFLHVIGPLHPAAAVISVKDSESNPPFAFVTGSSHAFVYYKLENTGNTLLNGTVTVRVTDIFGRTVKSFPATRVGNFLPGQTFSVLEPLWHPLPIIGPEHIQVTFKPRGAAVTTGASVFWIVPWVLILLVVAVLAGGYWWYRRRRRRRQQGPHPSPPGDPVEPSEHREPVAAAS